MPHQVIINETSECSKKKKKSKEEHQNIKNMKTLKLNHNYTKYTAVMGKNNYSQVE